MKSYKNKRGYTSIELVFAVFMISVLIGTYMELSAMEIRLLEKQKDGIDDLNRIISFMESDMEGIVFEKADSREVYVFEDERIEVEVKKISKNIYLVKGVSKENERIGLETYVWIED